MNKFSWQQMTSNSDGKTSSTGTMGCICILAGVLGFIIGAIYYIYVKDSQIMTQSLMLIGSGTALLAYRKAHDGPLASSIANQPEETPTEPTPGVNQP